MTRHRIGRALLGPAGSETRPHTDTGMSFTISGSRKSMLSRVWISLTAGAIALSSSAATLDNHMDFGPDNPFYAPSTLPFHAPPFDKIKDGDYQPAIDAGMAEQRREIRAIADNPAPPTFENTLVALERTGQSVQSCHGRVQRRHRSEPESRTAEGAGLRGAQAGRPLRRDLSRLQIVPARGRDLPATRIVETRCGSAAPGGVLLQEICALRRQSF